MQLEMSPSVCSRSSKVSNTFTSTITFDCHKLLTPFSAISNGYGHAEWERETSFSHGTSDAWAKPPGLDWIEYLTSTEWFNWASIHCTQPIGTFSLSLSLCVDEIALWIGLWVRQSLVSDFYSCVIIQFVFECDNIMWQIFKGASGNGGEKVLPLGKSNNIIGVDCGLALVEYCTW